MKHINKWLYLVVVVFVTSLLSFAPASKDIPLKGKTNDPDYRSVFQKCIYASIDGDVLYSEFTDSVGEVQIIITNSTDNEVVLQETVTVNNPQSHMLKLPEIAKGNYMIRYYYGENYLFGNFEIE